MKNIEEIMDSFLEDYKENPKGWSFWTDKSDDFYNIYVINEDKGYFIKIDSIYNNNPLGMGTEIDIEKDQLEDELPNFGFRRFSRKELKNFMEALSSVKDESQKKELFEKQMRKKPTLPTEADEEEYMMVGPFNKGSPFQYSLEQQKEVDKRLRKKLMKKFRRKYKMYQ
ncbi:MAG: hypothetical protein KGY76_04080 [Candidatus Thermoplasmatota archaeon]|nr:hypothetical protein [Candidatus Thermoplasmatota archaeon]